MVSHGFQATWLEIENESVMNPWFGAAAINGACVAVGSPTPAGKTIIIGQGTFTGAGYFVGTGEP